ncbi:MAG TPA: carbon monoxide dehydrogenase, partial [Pyrodictium sp.]|nr:carbon monoxide dehydrogenase [Pyrodictium sp.]
VGTGCWALSAAIHGLLSPEAAKIAGPGLRSLCEKLGIPPAIHMGSCVDCSRILLVLATLAEELNVDIADLPVVGSAPEWMSEKAVSIGTYFVATGVMVHLGVEPPVLGSRKVAKLLTEDLEAIVGAKFYVEPNPKKAAETIIAYIEEKRRKLGWPV